MVTFGVEMMMAKFRCDRDWGLGGGSGLEGYFHPISVANRPEGPRIGLLSLAMVVSLQLALQLGFEAQAHLGQQAESRCLAI